MPDLYFFREPEDIEKEEQAAALAAAKPEETYPSDWNTGAVAPASGYEAPAAQDWDAKAEPASADVSTYLNALSGYPCSSVHPLSVRSFIENWS